MLIEKKKEHLLQLIDTSVVMLNMHREDGQLILDEIKATSIIDITAARSEIKSFFLEKSTYIPARCSVYPRSSFVRKSTLGNFSTTDFENYLTKFLKENYEIDINDYSIKILNALDGFVFGGGDVPQSEVVICGVQKEDIKSCQSFLVELGIYPESLELADVSILAGLVDYTAFIGTSVVSLVINENSSELFIVNKGSVNLVRSIPFGVNSIFSVVQKELGLHDEVAARDLCFSGTFDFTDKGKTILARFCNEIQNAIDYYEVQTGISVVSLFLGNLDTKTNWIGGSISKSLNLSLLEIDYSKWLVDAGILVSSQVDLTKLDSIWFGLFSLAVGCCKRIRNVEGMGA